MLHIVFYSAVVLVCWIISTLFISLVLGLFHEGMKESPKATAACYCIALTAAIGLLVTSAPIPWWSVVVGIVWTIATAVAFKRGTFEPADYYGYSY